MDYEWITGGEENIVHMDVIAHGGFGEVHKVF